MTSFTITVLVLHLTVFVLNAALGWLVIRSQPHSRVNQLFGLYAISLALWNISLFSTITGMGGTTPQLWWSRLAFSFYLAMINGFFYFTLIYSGIWRVPFWFRLIFWGGTSVLFILTLTPWLVVGEIKIIEGFITGKLGPLITFFSWYYVAFILLSIFVLSLGLMRSHGSARQKLWYILAGFSLFAIPMILTNMVLPVFFGVFRYNNLGPLFSFPMLVVIGYAIIRYRLLDVEVVIRRGAVFSLLFGILAFLFTAGVSYLGNYLPQPFSQLTVALAIAFLFIPLKNFLETATDRIFFRKRYRLEDAVRNLGHLLVRNPRLEKLLSALLRYLTEVLKAEKAAALLEETPGKFSVAGASGPDGRGLFLTDASPLIRFFASRPYPDAKHEKEILDREELTYELAHSRMRPELRHQWETVIEELTRLGFSLAIPVIFKEKLLGVLLLGEKRSGDPFSRNDLHFLDIVSHEAASFIENALNFERMLRLDEVRSEFISVVSHQLRTPLSVSRWNFELLFEGAFGEIGPKAKEVLGETYQALMALNQGLNNFMTALEIESGKIVLRLQETDIHSGIIEWVLTRFDESVRTRRLKVEKEFLFQGTILLDRNKIERVVEALFDNAVRYSPPASAVRIRTERREEAEIPELMVSLEDRGIGVTEQNRGFIFQRFFRGEEAKKVSPSGFGLGLYIAKAYVEMHGGRIWTEGRKDGGSIFRFTIPVKR